MGDRLKEHDELAIVVRARGDVIVHGCTIPASITARVTVS
jgi:hypothetical protein